MENCFSDNLKSLRSERGITQAQLADAMRVSVKTVSHWETCYTEPCIRQILELSEYFGISLEELLS